MNEEDEYEEDEEEYEEEDEEYNSTQELLDNVNTDKNVLKTLETLRTRLNSWLIFILEISICTT